ncbi:chemotaxis protein CheW [bacterium]|nr:chemotaxis protein CheW [bacterium]
MAENNTPLRLLHFRSGNKDYAMDLGCVKEIIRMAALDQVAELPEFVKGIINLRGETLPVVDFLSRSGAGTTAIQLKTRVIIMKINSVTLGLMVDEVKETLEVQEKDISRNIQPDVVIDPKYIFGTFLFNEHMTILVDVHKLFTANEFKRLEQDVINA